MDSELLIIELEDLEWEVLSAGLREWGGPARCTEETAVAMGFSGLHEFWQERDRLSEALASRVPLCRLDWARVSIATELVFISDFIGSGSDWKYTVGIDDSSTLIALRSIQAKLTKHLRPLVGQGFGTRPADDGAET